MKRNIKKSLSAALAALFFGMGLVGCTQGDGISASGDTVKIVTTNFALYDFARVYENDRIQAEMLIAPGSESHDLEVTLSDISVISSADIFVYAGGESDTWVDAVFESLGAEGEDIVRICALDVVEGLEETHTHEGELHTTEDEHVWTSIPNAMKLIREIGQAIQQVDETEELSEAEASLADLNELDAEYREMMASASRNEIVVADRFPFVYLAEEYGIEYTAAFDGCTSNVEVPLAVINTLIDEVREKQLPAVFYIEFSDRTAVNAVCEETGAEPLLLHSCHNVTKEDFEAGVTYLDLMRRNLENLKKALN